MLFYSGMSVPLLAGIDCQEICMDLSIMCFKYKILLYAEIMHHTECYANCHGKAKSTISQLVGKVPLEIFIHIYSYIHFTSFILYSIWECTCRLHYGNNTADMDLFGCDIMVKFYSSFIGSCILKASIVDISISTQKHCDWPSNDTQMTLNQHLLNTWSIVGWVSTDLYVLIENWSTLNQLFNEMLIKCQPLVVSIKSAVSLIILVHPRVCTNCTSCLNMWPISQIFPNLIRFKC